MRSTFHTALCSLALLAAPAHAGEGQVDVFIHDFSIELIDLEPGDSIAPGITWGNRTGRGNVYLGEGAYADNDELLGPGVISVTSLASASSFEARDKDWRLHAASSAQIEGHTYVGTYFDARLFFTLTPHTGMFVRALADIDAASDYAQSNLFAHAGISGYAGGSSFFDSFTSYQPLSTSRILFGYVHSDADGGSGGLEFRGSSSIEIPAAPIPGVPEPSSWALLAAGLGLLAAAGRRARRRMANRSH